MLRVIFRAGGMPPLHFRRPRFISGRKVKAWNL
jgi:hypothetical protein